MVIEKTLEYCRSILKNVSRSFALTIPMVEKNILEPILVGYLEARILDSFEDEKGGQDIFKAKRVEKIRKVMSIIDDPEGKDSEKLMEDIARSAPNFIANPHYLDLVRNMDKVMDVHKKMDTHSKSVISLWFGRMAEGMEKYLNKRIDTFEQLDEYCYYVGGTVGGMLTDLIIKKTGAATTGQIKTLKMERNDFGLFLQKVNIIRDFRQDILNNEKIFWPHQVFREHGLMPRDTLSRKNKRKAMSILDRMITNSTNHIKHVRKYISAIPEDFPGFRNSSIVNYLMGIETLAKLKDNSDVFYSDMPVKIDKLTAKDIISNPVECFENHHHTI